MAFTINPNTPTMASYVPSEAAFTDLFKDKGGSTAFLDSLIGKDAGAYLANLSANSTSTTAAAQSPAATSTSGDMTDPKFVAQMAKQNGWADPYAFNTSMLTKSDFDFSSEKFDHNGNTINQQTAFKPEFAAARGITDTGRNLNKVEVIGNKRNYAQHETATADDFTETPGGYKVLAGAVPGTKNHTALYYQYDKDGKFMGANFDMEERGLEGAAPLVNMALMAMGAGGALGTVGSSINSSLGLGLGNIGQAALGGAAVGGGAAALTGQDVLKGAAMGGVGSAVSAANPAGALGITDPKLLKIVNSGASNLAKATISGKDPTDVLIDTAVGAVLPPTMSTILNIAKR